MNGHKHLYTNIHLNFNRTSWDINNFHQKHNNLVTQTPNLELLEFKRDKDQTTFTLQTVQLQKGDLIYILTDGMPDQFDGEKGKKYMIKNLKNLFLSIGHLPTREQYTKLEEEFNNWKGDNEQVDDVVLLE